MEPKSPRNREQVMNLGQRGLRYDRMLHQEGLDKPVMAKSRNKWEGPTSLSEGLPGVSSGTEWVYG